MELMITPPGDSPAYWVGNTEFVTVKATGSDTDGAFALLELVALPGAEPPPHVHHGTDETYYLVEGGTRGPGRRANLHRGGGLGRPLSQREAARLAQRHGKAGQGA